MDTDFRAGDTISVYEKIKEGEKNRLHEFEGVVLSIRGSGINKSFTIRKISFGGMGVERIWPINCPSIEKIVIRKKGAVRRAKLYYLRNRIGKQALAVKTSDKVSVKEKPNVKIKPQ